jgi:ribosomal 50S subunit-associated protein YjgA (DUF615 family)
MNIIEEAKRITEAQMHANNGDKRIFFQLIVSKLTTEAVERIEAKLERIEAKLQLIASRFS